MLAWLVLAAAAASPPARFDVEKIAEGVFALVRMEPPGLLPEGNAVFIVDEDGVVVVDTNLLLASAKESLAALRKLTSKPVRYVINTHWHDDHVTGNQVYLDAFPGLEIVAHQTGREDMTGVGAENRKHMLEDGPPFTDRLRKCIETGKTLAGAPMSPGERAAYQSDVAIFDEYAAQAGRVRLTPPTIGVADKLTLHRPGRDIEVRWLGRAHSRGDLVVLLPKEGILLGGDVVARPVIVGDKSYLADWIGTLEKLRALGPKLIVPGHGAVQRDNSYVALLHDMLVSVKGQTEAAVLRGETLEQALRV
jgi:cyclase